MNIQLGSYVEDNITKFRGIVTARVEYINGCVQYCVQPRVMASEPCKMPDATYFDWQRLQVLRNANGEPIVLHCPAKPTGGPQRDTPSATYRG